MLAIRAIGSEIGLECDRGNTYDGGNTTHPNRYYIIRSLNLLKILKRVVQLYLINSSHMIVTMPGYTGLATYIIFNLKRPNDTFFACDPEPFDACCYTITKRISASSPSALDLHLVTIYVCHSDKICQTDLLVIRL
jgi:hypothetical protein